MFLRYFSLKHHRAVKLSAPAKAPLAPANDCIFPRSVGDYSSLDRSHPTLRGPSRKRACPVAVTA